MFDLDNVLPEGGENEKVRCWHCRNSGIVALDPSRPVIRYRKPKHDGDPWAVVAEWPDGYSTERVVPRPAGMDDDTYRPLVAAVRDRLAALDGVPTGAPCPMCKLGSAVNLSMKTWDRPSQVAAAGWENGLSVRHRWRCRVDGCMTLVTAASSVCEFCTARQKHGGDVVVPPVSEVFSGAWAGRI